MPTPRPSGCVSGEPSGFTSLRVTFAVTLIGARGHPPPSVWDDRVGSPSLTPPPNMYKHAGQASGQTYIITIEITQFIQLVALDPSAWLSMKSAASCEM